MARYSWLGWAVPVALVAFLSLRQIGTADFWWQWSTGRWVLENGIPTHDPWLTTAEPREWIEMRWLYCAALYWSFENVGAWLPIIGAAVLYALGAVLALNTGGRASPSWLLAAGVALAAVAGRRLVVRPEVFSFVLLALLLWVIVQVRRGRLAPQWGVAAIGCVFVLWANTHALFAVGIGVCGLWLLIEAIANSPLWKWALLGVVVACLAVLVNPYGLKGAMFPFLLFEEMHVGAYRNNIIELRSPFAFGFSPSLFAHMALAAAVLWFAIRRRGGDVFLLLAAIATFYLSISVVRNAPLFGICAVAFLSSCDLKPNRPLSGVAIACAVVMAWSFAIGTWTIEDRMGLSLDRSRYALEAAKSLKGHQGKVFNSLVEGSLLIAQGGKAFCDPRLEVLPQERFVEMLDYTRLRKPLPEEFDTLFLTVESPLAAKLVKEDGWRVVGIDPRGIALIKDAGAVTDIGELVQRAKATIDLNPPSFNLVTRSISPVPYRRLASFFRNIGETEAANELIEISRSVYPSRVE